MIRAERLDEAVWSDVRALLLDPGRVEREYRRRLEGREDGGRARASESFGKQIAEARRRISRLMEMYEEGYLEREAFKERAAAARARLGRLEEESRAMREREQEAAALRLAIGGLGDFAERIGEGLDQGDRGVRQGVVRALVKRVEVGDEAIRIVYRVSPDPFVEGTRKGVAQIRTRSRER